MFLGTIFALYLPLRQSFSVIVSMMRCSSGVKREPQDCSEGNHMAWALRDIFARRDAFAHTQPRWRAVLRVPPRSRALSWERASSSRISGKCLARRTGSQQAYSVRLTLQARTPRSGANDGVRMRTAARAARWPTRCRDFARPGPLPGSSRASGLQALWGYVSRTPSGRSVNDHAVEIDIHAAIDDRLA